MLIYCCYMSRPDGGGEEEGPREGVHEVRAPQGDLAGQLRSILRFCRLQESTRCPGDFLSAFSVSLIIFLTPRLSNTIFQPANPYYYFSFINIYNQLSQRNIY